ncbi:MAG: bacteriohopanetetrol glucosamine biosynthesis glycosyltransferase HpnI [Terracidiphilus sp.]|nr:bacteriohopanetetrol glucosamine biosynthesis glycosyltransferase HpnI [Terracidiphilus sp.]MDR3775501.1 bacteriohopanetetrol glucosamine biosynthesis glycosyltransferase HpnI [Terracidiphilus sp.]
MPHIFAQSVEVLTTVLAVAGMGYFVAAMVAARAFLRSRRTPLPAFAPGVSILKSLKGIDPGMIDAFRSHCRQTYTGEYELLFGVSSLGDPAVAAVELLRLDFPHRSIRLIECPLRLGTNGKVSTLTQLAEHARYDFLLINDSDITVSPRYLERVMAHFAPPPEQPGKALPPVGLVTALYRGRAHGTLPSRLEALGIATDFQAGVLLSKMIEGSLHYGLGSTLAVSREALDKIGGLVTLVDYLADDYELGARVDRAGYRVALSAEVVETAIPAYGWRGFADHQLRWSRTVRDSRPWGYVGLIFTHGLGWALLNVLASGLSPVSLWLLGLSFFLRLTLAMMVGAEVLGDRQVLPSLWLLPLRDLAAMGIWVAGFAGNTIVWRGHRFVLHGGKLHPARR